MNHDQQHGLAISAPILRADAGKNACSASQGVKLVPACFHVASKEQDSAPPVFGVRQDKKLSPGLVYAATNDTCFGSGPLAVSGEHITATNSNNPRPSFDGLPCAHLPGANLAGGGVNRSQPLSFQSGDHFPNEFASSFPSQMSSLPRGVKP